MPEYKKGCMPNTDFRYEEFEGLLGSFYLSLLPLKEGKKPEDKADYRKVMSILNGFAQRYGVQYPEDAAKNPRAEHAWGNAEAMENHSLLGMMGSFYRDFGVGTEPNTLDQEEKNRLGRTILRVFDRYNIAKIGFDTSTGKRIPAKFREWNGNQAQNTLAEKCSHYMKD